MSFDQHVWTHGNDLAKWTEHDLPKPWIAYETQQTTAPDGRPMGWKALACNPRNDEIVIGAGRTEREALMNLANRLWEAKEQERRLQRAEERRNAPWWLRWIY